MSYTANIIETKLIDNDLYAKVSIENSDRGEIKIFEADSPDLLKQLIKARIVELEKQDEVKDSVDAGLFDLTEPVPVEPSNEEKKRATLKSKLMELENKLHYVSLGVIIEGDTNIAILRSEIKQLLKDLSLI